MSRLSEILAIWLGVDVLNPKHSDRLVRHLQRNFAQFPCDLVIDCGANRGQFARECRLAGYKGAIRSLEPLPVPFAELSANAARDPRWTAVQLAVGAANGELTLNFRPGREELASALSANPGMVERFHGLAFSATETVPLRRLDGLLADWDVPTTAKLFVKSDTQGFDLQVLHGLGERIAQVEGLALEMSVRPLYENMPSHWDMLDFVRANGFEPYGFATVSRDATGGMIEYDALFRRSHPRAKL